MNCFSCDIYVTVITGMLVTSMLMTSFTPLMANAEELPEMQEAGVEKARAIIKELTDKYPLPGEAEFRAEEA